MLRPLLFLPLLLATLVGLLRPAAAFTSEQARAPMTVTLVRSDAATCGADCPEWLALTGKIGFETPARLAAALARLGQRRVPVLLDSPGGESLAALAMGHMIRARGLDTAVATTTWKPCYATDDLCRSHERAGGRSGHIAGLLPGSPAPACASACVLVLAAGVDRAVPPGAFVGVHQARQVRTFHPVMNTFRILSRTVNGRRIEISRTLVASRAMPVRVVSGAAPQSIYSEFDRYLLGVGVDESIMTLMRATPPSGIHWLTAAELAQTRISTDTVDAPTLVSREAAAQAAADQHRQVHLAAALTLYDARRWKGGATWHVDATTAGKPALVADWEIPERQLRGTVTIAATDAPGITSSFEVLTRFASGPGRDAARVLSVQAPQICDAARCMLVIEGNTMHGASTADFQVASRWRSAFLGDLRQFAWLRLFVRTTDGFGSIDLPLASPEANAVTGWERVCCAFEATDLPLATPITEFPAFRDPPEPFLITGLGPVRPAMGGGKAAPRSIDMQAAFDGTPMQQHGFPTAVHGTTTWFPLASPTTTGGPGTNVLIGTAEVPALGLHVSIEAGASRPGVLGRLTVRLHTLTDDPSTFGPLGRIFALNTYDAQGHTSLLVDGVDGSSKAAEDEVYLDIPESGPIAGAFQVGFEDAKGRRVTLAFPFDPAVAALLQSASRQGAASGT